MSFSGEEERVGVGGEEEEEEEDGIFPSTS